MPKLIDADKLKQHYAWWDNEDKKIFDTIIDLQPEAVVRCKDCKHLCVRSGALGVYQCAIHGDFPSGEYFCADGERREDGNKPKSI